MEYCAVLYLVAQLYPILCDLMDCSLPVSSIHGDFPGKNTAEDFHALLQGIFPNPEIKPWSPKLQLDSLLSGLPEKPTMEYYLHIKKNEIMSFAATWMDQEMIILNEVIQTEKNKYHMISLTCRIKKKKSDTKELIYKTKTNSLTSRPETKFMVTQGNCAGRERLRVWD